MSGYNDDTSGALEIESSMRKATVGELDSGEMSRSKIITIVSWIILAILVIVYFAYETINYLDTDENRKSYTLDQTVDEMPLPYIYIEWQNLSNASSCSVNVDFANNRTGVNVSLDRSDYLEIDLSDNDYEEYDIDDILDDTTSGAEDWLLVKSAFGGQEQVLVIPGKDATVDVNSRDAMSLMLTCNSSQIPSYGFAMYYELDHRDQLREYGYLDDVMIELYFTSTSIYPGYEVNNMYQWFAYDNRIDTDESFHDYFIATIGATFALDNEFQQAIIIAQPNSVGKKTVFVTTKDTEILDVFSQTGGIYSLIRDGVALVLAFLLWGNLFSVTICKGAAPNTNPDEVEPRLSDQINTEFAQRDATIANLAQKIRQLEAANGESSR